MRFRSVHFALPAVGLLFSLPASSSTFAPVSDAELVREASDVVRGSVVEVSAAWDAEGAAIWTTATLRVQASIKGRLRPGTLIRVKEVGGTLDGYTIKADGFPTFHKGDEVVVLLRKWEDASKDYRVWGYGRGMFNVIRRPNMPAAAYRYDVVESGGRPTMFRDRLAPTLWLSQLDATLRSLTLGR